MSQGAVLEVFQGYLSLLQEKHTAALENKKASANSLEEKEKIDRELKNYTSYMEELISALKSGHCHGFSICHAVMDLEGKQEWWENSYPKMMEWDGSEEALAQEVNLPGSTQPQTLGQLIERALNYIVYYQGTYKIWFREKNTQQLLLQPAPSENKSISHFELLTADHKIVTIKNRATAAGYFDQNDLLNLLDETQIKGNICLISSTSLFPNVDGHTIRIGHNGQSWIVYDPEYDHSNPDTLHKTFSDKKTAVLEIIERLRGDLNAISIEIATTRDQIIAFPYFDEMLKNKMDFLDKSGLRALVKHAPEAACQLFERASEQNEHTLLKKIIGALKYKESSGLGMISRESIPQVAKALIKLGTKLSNEDLRTAIFNPEKDFHYLLAQAPEALGEVLTWPGTINKIFFNNARGNAHKRAFSAFAQLVTKPKSQDLRNQILRDPLLLQQLQRNDFNTESQENIMQTLEKHLEIFKNEELIELGKKLRIAPFDQNAEYYPLVSIQKSASSIFSNNQIDVRQRLLSNIQKLLLMRINHHEIIPNSEIEELLKQNFSPKQ